MRYLILFMALGACSTTDSFGLPVHQDPTGIGVRASATVATGELTATRTVQKSRNGFAVEQTSETGSGGGGRFEIFKTLGDYQLGAFYGSQSMDYADSEDIGLTLRGYFMRPGENLRPYSEVRVAYRTTEMGSVVPGSPDIRDSAGGLSTGLGLGLEYKLGRGVSTFLQLNGNYHEVSISATDTNAVELEVQFGFGVTF